MNEEVKQEKTVIKPEDVDRFLHHQAKIQKCNYCDNETWIIATDDNDFVIQIPLVSSNGGYTIPPPRNIPLIGLVCEKCANTRFLARNLVEAFLKSEKKS